MYKMEKWGTTFTYKSFLEKFLKFLIFFSIIHKKNCFYATLCVLCYIIYNMSCDYIICYVMLCAYAILYYMTYTI